MKVPRDALISALLNPRLLLSGDENGGVGIYCRDHFDSGRPLAYYHSSSDAYPDPAVPTVATIPGLWAQAVDHLATLHAEPR